MNKLGKILGLLLVVCVVGIVSVQALGLSFTLQETLIQAKDADIDALFAERDIDTLIDAKDEAIEDADETNVLAGTAQTQLNSKVKKYIEPLRAEMNLSIALRDEEQRLNQREIDITNAYWQVYLAKLTMEKAKIELQVANNNYEAAKIKLSNGSISGSSLAAQRYSYESKQLSVIEANNKHKKALFSLNELLGNELTNNITIKDQLQLLVPLDWSYNIDSVYETALETSEDIYKLMKEAEFAAMKLQYADEEFRTTEDEYLDVLTEKEKADYSYQNAKNNLYQDITTDGNNILTSLENYKLLKLKLVTEKNNLQAMEIKLNSGEISKNDYLEAELNVLNYEYQLNSAIVNLNYLYQNFNNIYIFQGN